MTTKTHSIYLIAVYLNMMILGSEIAILISIVLSRIVGLVLASITTLETPRKQIHSLSAISMNWIYGTKRKLTASHRRERYVRISP